jgi:hypothetical protein
MDEKQKKELERKEAEKNLDASDARLRVTRARAEEREAAAALVEIGGLSSLQARLRKKIGEWKDADLESWHQLQTDVRAGAAKLSKQLDAANEHLDRFDDAADRQMNAEMDQIEASFDLMNADLDEVWKTDQKVATTTKEALEAAEGQLKESRRKLKEAGGRDAAKTRAAVQRSLDAIKRRSAELGAKLHPSHQAAPA